jgi:hypothetical protein
VGTQLVQFEIQFHFLIVDDCLPCYSCLTILPIHKFHNKFRDRKNMSLRGKTGGIKNQIFGCLDSIRVDDYEKGVCLGCYMVFDEPEGVVDCDWHKKWSAYWLHGW